jgi:hypothetical protein
MTPYVETGVATVSQTPPSPIEVQGGVIVSRRQVSVIGLNSYTVLPPKNTTKLPLFGSVVTIECVVPNCCGALPSRVIWRLAFMR